MQVEGSTKARFRERPEHLDDGCLQSNDEDEADYNRSFELIEAWLNDVKAKNPQTETVFMSE